MAARALQGQRCLGNLSLRNVLTGVSEDRQTRDELQILPEG